MDTKKFAKPLGKSYGPNRFITATVSIERQYFSVTGEIGNPCAADCDMCGCIHDEILKHFPQLAPLVRLHLSSTVGMPMHAEANGFYWLAGAAGGLGETYHGSSGSSAKSQQDCLRILAEHCRTTLEQAREIVERVANAPDPRAEWLTVCVDFVEQWNKEGHEGLALFHSL